MECNKDEAVRAKDIAVKKFTEKDMAGAKKFALKAQNLYSGLEGLPQFLATLDVYISAEKKINGEVDWYGVLGVDPLADDDAIRKHYRKLALTLHPDKNKSVGADGAFKILSEAWSLLSDKAKRNAYNEKRNIRGVYQNLPTENPPVPAGRNGFHNFTNGVNSNAKGQKSTTRPKPAPAAPRPKPAPTASRPSKPNTFWTVCNRCKMQYEYLINYLNHTLLCPNCHEPFLAIETPPPPLNGHKSSTPWAAYQQRQNSSSHVTNRNSTTPKTKPTATPNAGSAGFSGVDSFNHANFRNVPASSGAAQATKVDQPAWERLKRGREEAQATVMREDVFQRKFPASKETAEALGTGSGFVHSGERRMKKRRIDDCRMHGTGGEVANQMAMRNGGVGLGNVFSSHKNSPETVRFSVNNRSNSSRELSQPELRNMLMEKAKMEIRKTLNDWRVAAASKTLGKEGKGKEKEKQDASVNVLKNSASRHKNFGVPENEVHTKKTSPATIDADTDSDTKANKLMVMTVPDPDFHDFDGDRTEKAFGENQVWAAYDDDDGMPRYYAMIHGVISLKPFKMRISWLNSKSNNELAPINWVGSGFTKTSGDFRVGKYEVNKNLNSFSHKVKWAKGTRGAIQIYPSKGDVWALYRNWSPDWSELTPDEVIHKYDMVEVLEDYKEEHGVTVTPLIKVAGFKTVFHRHLDPMQVRKFPREELFRFSHQVPSHLLTGQEAQNAPKGCRELDPAATPLELLQVVTEIQAEKMENAKNLKEDVLVDVEGTNKVKGIIEDAKTFEGEVIVKNVEEPKVGEVLDIIKEGLGKTRLEDCE